MDIETLKEHLEWYKTAGRVTKLLGGGESPIVEDLTFAITELATLKERVERAIPIFNDYLAMMEFLNPFGVGHPNLRLVAQFDNFKKALRILEGK